MPYYDFECKDCGSVMTVKASISDKEAGLNVNCSSCGSKKTEQVFKEMTVLAGGISEPAPVRSSAPSGGSCGRGCGCHPN